MAASMTVALAPEVAACLTRHDLPAGGRGWSAAAAGILEATAPKPGNVHPGASFPDLRYADLVAAAVASGRVLERAATVPLGRTILDAIEAARAAADTNANLGIVLLTAPLAAIPEGEPVDPGAVDRVLARLDAGDAALVYRAIARARPGGMGTVATWDVAGTPPVDLMAAMREAAHRDQIARLWAEGFTPLFAGPVADLATAIAAGTPLLDAIVECHVHQLAREQDSLIRRKHGAIVASRVSEAAAAVVRLPAGARPAALDALDASLRSPHRLNPGTTADIVAAALYILLRSGRLPVTLVAAEPPLPPSSSAPSP